MEKSTKGSIILIRNMVMASTLFKMVELTKAGGMMASNMELGLSNF
jgi:hypothetical protein